MTIDWLKLFFYSYAIVALFGATMVILSRNSVRAVLFLVLTFVSSSGLWMLLQSEFLALTLILVYVGAVMVLFLFVVMMLNMNISPLKEGFVRYLPVGLLIAAAIVAQLIWVYNKTDMAALYLGELVMKPADYNNIKELGLALYTDYLYPFEIAGVILLVAIVAAIALTFRGPQHRRKQSISAQVATQKSDRLRMVKNMDPNSDLKV